MSSVWQNITNNAISAQEANFICVGRYLARDKKSRLKILFSNAKLAAHLGAAGECLGFVEGVEGPFPQCDSNQTILFRQDHLWILECD